MKLKKILSVLIAAVMLLCISPAAFAEEEISVLHSGSVGVNITWTYDETLKMLTFDGEGKLPGVLRVSMSGTVTLPAYREQAKFAKKIVIGDKITEIGDDALSGFFYVKEIDFGSGVETIGNHSFAQLKSLENLTVSANVKTIGIGAFENCISLKSLILENGVETVGDSAFAGAYTLKNVSIPESVREIGENAFTLFVPDAKYINESQTAAIVPSADKLNSYTFTSYDYAEQYAYYLWLDGDLNMRNAYEEKEILAGIYEKFGVSYLNLRELEDDFYNNIAIDSVFADGAVIECLADSVQHKICSGSGVNHEVTDSDFDCLCGYHDVYENDYIAPTCINNGYIGGTVCLECEKIFEDADVVPAPGHTDEDGDHICDVCGSEIERTLVERVTEFFKGIVNSILALFRKLFG